MLLLFIGWALHSQESWPAATSQRQRRALSETPSRSPRSGRQGAGVHRPDGPDATELSRAGRPGLHSRDALAKQRMVSDWGRLPIGMRSRQELTSGCTLADAWTLRHLRYGPDQGLDSQLAPLRRRSGSRANQLLVVERKGTGATWSAQQPTGISFVARLFALSVHLCRSKRVAVHHNECARGDHSSTNT